MERSASAPGRGAGRGARAGIVALFTIFVVWPDAPRVSGSVPLSVSLAVSMPVPLAPPSEGAALLESQGEFVLAEAALEADSLSSLDPERVQARLRIACRRGDTSRARALLAAHDSLFASDVARLLGAALAAKAGDPAACLATLEGGPVPAGLERWLDDKYEIRTSLQINTGDIGDWFKTHGAESVGAIVSVGRGVVSAVVAVNAPAQAGALEDEMLEPGAWIHQTPAALRRGVELHRRLSGMGDLGLEM